MIILKIAVVVLALANAVISLIELRRNENSRMNVFKIFIMALIILLYLGG